MPEVFINYRTSDGKDPAFRIYDELTRRFGEGRAFLASRSIPKGADYAMALDQGVRRSTVLLALIGPRWLDEPDRERPERRALDRADDWVRREIEEAFAWSLVVLPVLIGRHAEQLDRDRLPESIARLAECQYTRFTLRTAAHDLKELGDELARIIPAFAAADRDAGGQGDGTPGAVGTPTAAGTPRPGAGAAPAGSGGAPGGIGTRGDHHGTLIGEAHGILHSGTGALYQVDGITGDAHLGDRFEGGLVQGDSYGGDRVAGDKFGGDRVGGDQAKGDGAAVLHGDGQTVSHTFGTARRRRADER